MSKTLSPRNLRRNSRLLSSAPPPSVSRALPVGVRNNDVGKQSLLFGDYGFIISLISFRLFVESNFPTVNFSSSSSVAVDDSLKLDFCLLF